MTVAFPKPTHAKKRIAKAKKRKPNVGDFLAFVASQPCVVPGCRNASHAHHVLGGVSLKTRLPLRRRQGLAFALAAPACMAHHQTDTVSIHSVGERAFERHHGLPEFHLLALAASLLAAYVCGEAAS